MKATTGNTAASVRALCELKDVDEAIAEQIRAVWRSYSREQLLAEFPTVAKYDRDCYYAPPMRMLRRMAVDCLLDTCGVEYLGMHKRQGVDAYYCNAGDPYATTVLFIGSRLLVATWGYLVERNQIREQ